MLNYFKKGLALFAVLVLVWAVFSPSLAEAQISVSNPTAYQNTTVCTGSGVLNAICRVHAIINALVPLLIGLGVLYFVWGVVQYVIAGGEEAKTQGRDRIIYGVIGLAVIVGFWGLINIVVSTFGLEARNVSIPTLVPSTSGASAGISGAGCDLGSNPKFQNVLGYVTCLINNSVIPLVFAFAVVMFIWGIVQYVILGADEESKRTAGRQHMIWGIIALVVMLGFWSLVSVVGGTFGLNTRVLPSVSPSSSR